MSPSLPQVAEFDILYGIGISREGSLIDLGVEQGFVRKSGAWYTYEGDQLGQGKENARNFLRDNPDMANEIEKRIKEKLGVGARLDADPASANGQAAGNGVAPERTPTNPATNPATPRTPRTPSSPSASSRPGVTIPGVAV